MADPVYYINSGGSIVPVAPEQQAEVSQLGWLPASDKQIADFKIGEKYGGTGQQVIAGLEGLARGATARLSTAAETALGVPAEDIVGREKAHPATATLSELGGVGGSLLLGAGVPSLLGKAGAAVGARAGAGIAGTLAGAATEGGLWGAGQVVHEAALGDPDLTAQSALATIGLSAGLFGAASGAGKLLGKAVAEYAPKDLAAKVSEMLEEAEAHSNFNATNAMPTLIKKTMRGKGGGAREIGLAGRDLGILKDPISDSVEAISDRASELKNTSGAELGQLADAAGPEPVTTWTKVYQDVHQPIVNALRAQGSTVGLADQFESFLGKYAEAYAGKDLSVADLWKVRQDVGDFIYQNGKVLDPWVKELNKPVKRVYDHLDQLLKDGIEEQGGTGAVKAWEDASHKYEVASTFSTLAQSGIERSAANNPLHISGMFGAVAGAAAGGLGGGAVMGTLSEVARRRGASAVGYMARILRNALDNGGSEIADKTMEMVAAARQAGNDTLTPALTSDPQAVHVMAALGKMNETVGNRIDSGASAIIEREGKAGRGEVSAGIARWFGDDAETATENFNTHAEKLRALSADPEQMQQALVDQTQDWSQHAPKTAQAMQVASSRALAFLAGKLPIVQRPGPLGEPFAPSQDAIAKFNRYREAIDNPLSIMRQAAAGTLTPEGIEAVQTAYPAIYQKMQASIIDKLASGKDIPYASRLMLALMLGKDLDGTLTPQAMQQNAAVLAPKQPASPGPSPSASKITLHERMQLNSKRAVRGE